MNADPLTHAGRYMDAMARLADAQAAQEWAEDRATDRAVVEIDAIRDVDLSPRVVRILLARICGRLQRSNFAHMTLATASQEHITDAIVALEELED